MADEFDPYYAWLGIPPKDQPPNHYRLLGLELFETNLDVIESAAFRQMGHVRTYQGGKNSRESQQLLNELSAAKICLLHPEQKQLYDQQLRATIEAITAFLPDESLDAALPTAIRPSETDSVLDVVPVTGPSGSAVTRSASVSAIRRKRPQPASRIPIVAGTIVAVVCLGIAVMFGGKFLQRETPATNRPTVPAIESPPVADNPSTEVVPPAIEPVPTNDTPGPPPTADGAPAVASTPNTASPANTVPAAPQPATALNESKQRFPQLPSQIMQSRLRVPLVPHVRDKFEEAAGIADTEFAFAQTMPYNDFLAMVFQLRNVGYRPLRVRPYLVNGESRIASIWTRDAVDWRMVIGVDSVDVEQADQTLKSQGFQPVDVACWQTDRTKFAAVWAADPNQTALGELTLGIAANEFPAAAAAARKRGMTPLSIQMSDDGKGERRYSLVWRASGAVIPWHHWDGDRKAHENALKTPGPPQDVCLLYRATGDLMYGGLSVGLPDPNTLELHGYDAEDHLDQCRNLVSQGYRPIAIAAAAPPAAQQTITGSVWQRGNRPTEAARNPTPGIPVRPMTSATAKATHALRFEGRDSIMIANSRALASTRNSFTAEMWFRFVQPAPQPACVMMGTTAYRELHPEVSNGASNGWYVTCGQRQADSPAESTALRWANSSGGIIGITGSATPPLGSDWHHLAVCNSPMAGGTWRLRVFLDGRLTQFTTRSANEATPSPSDFFLSASRFVTDRHNFFHGDIKAFRLSSNVRYQTTFSPPTVFASDSSTLSLLDFNGTTQSNVSDLSGNNRHGVISGAQWVVADAPVNSPMAAVTEPPPAELRKDRVPVPSKDERDAGSKKVRDIFASDFEAAKDKPAKLALAKDLLQRGQEEQDAAAKFALLYESRALLLEAADLNMALEATDELSAWFEVDPWTLKCDTLTKLADANAAGMDRHAIATTSLELADEAIGNSDWESAEKLLVAASRANVRLRDRDVLRAVTQKRKQFQTHKKLWEEAEQASTALADSPEDGQANLTLGRYHCFVKGEWDVGLPHLAKGSDDALAKLAQQDTMGPQGETALTLANQWHEWGEKAPDSDKNGALLRARHWYTSALPHLSGLDRTVATKKLEELSDIVEEVSANGKQLSWLDGPVGELKRLEGHTSEVTTLDVSRSGTMLVSGSSDGTVRVWSLADGKETGQIRSSVSRINKVALIRDDQFVLVVGSRSTAEIWNVRTGKPATSMTVQSSIRDAALSDDDKIFVCARSTSSSGNIMLYNMGTGAAAGQLNCPSYPTAVTLSRTGRLVAAGSGDDNVYVWNLASGQIAAPFTGLGNNPDDVAISPNENLVAGSVSNQVMIWELATGKLLSRSTAVQYPSQLVFSADNRRLLSAGLMHQVSIINVEDGNVIQTLTGKASNSISMTRAITYLPDSRGAVSTGYDGIIRVWRLPD